MTTGAERAYRDLREAIIAGEFVPGTKLTEVALSERLEVSRTPIREALRHLAKEGLVEIEPNRGARVAQWTPDDLAEIFRLRALLEAHAAHRAAVLRTEDEVAQMEECLAGMDRLGDRRDAEAAAERTRLNNELHAAVAAAARSPRLEELLLQLVNATLVLRTFERYSPDALERSRRQHHDLVLAVRARNPELAAATMSAHVLVAHAELAGRADAPDP